MSHPATETGTSRDGPAPRLRPIEPRDHDRVLALNQHLVHVLAPLDARGLDELLQLADRAEVVELGDAFAGFVITLAPGVDYDSQNYRWFTEWYADRFYYLDRVALNEDMRRRGLGGFVYDDVERTAAAYGRLALEVNAVPPNEPSLAFHAKHGFTEVGRIGDEFGQVAMMTKELA